MNSTLLPLPGITSAFVSNWFGWKISLIIDSKDHSPNLPARVPPDKYRFNLESGSLKDWISLDNSPIVVLWISIELSIPLRKSSDSSLLLSPLSELKRIRPIIKINKTTI